LSIIKKPPHRMRRPIKKQNRFLISYPFSISQD
jgi:hypothetical protein